MSLHSLWCVHIFPSVTTHVLVSLHSPWYQKTLLDFTTLSLESPHTSYHYIVPGVIRHPLVTLHTPCFTPHSKESPHSPWFQDTTGHTPSCHHSLSLMSSHSLVSLLSLASPHFPRCHHSPCFQNTLPGETTSSWCRYGLTDVIILSLVSQQHSQLSSHTLWGYHTLATSLVSLHTRWCILSGVTTHSLMSSHCLCCYYILSGFRIHSLVSLHTS